MGEGLKRARDAAKATNKPDDAEERAKECYEIYRGMKQLPSALPHWDELPREMKGLLEWAIRFDRFTRS